jgi:hypothetical protein
MAQRRSNVRKELEASITAQQGAAASVSVSPAEFDQLYQNVEKLSEEVGQFNAFGNQIQDYLAELQADVGSKRRTRMFVASLAVFVVAAMIGLLVYVLFCPLSPVATLGDSDQYLRIAVVIGPLAVILTLVAILVRGAFAMPTKDEIPGLPEHIKAIMEAIKPFKTSG